MTDRITLSLKNGIAEVALNRAEKRNALDLDMFDGLIEMQRLLAAEPGLRVVILRAEGPAFCAGIDLALFSQGRSVVARLLAPVNGGAATVAQQTAIGWRQLPVPVIAVLHGSVFGGGFQIAMGADLRLATPDAQLSVMEIRWGIIPDMGITTTLRHLLPLDVALDLTFSGRIVDAQEALALGLVTKVVDDPLPTARVMAEDLLNRSPDALRAAKQLFLDSWSSDSEAGLQREASLQKGLLGDPNQVEAVTAALQKRKPTFTTG